MRLSESREVSQAVTSAERRFKQFPTKAELFEATVLAAGDVPDMEVVDPPTGDFHAGLVVLGLAYAELLVRPRKENLIRTLIAEAPRFPELRERTFDFGTIASAVFWPRLVHGNWSLTEAETVHTVDEAARTIVARYAAPSSSQTPSRSVAANSRP